MSPKQMILIGLAMFIGISILNQITVAYITNPSQLVVSIVNPLYNGISLGGSLLILVGIIRAIISLFKRKKVEKTDV